MVGRSRAQSEVVGVVLLTAVVVVLVIGAGGLFLSSLDSDTDREPLADLESEVNATVVTLAHQGGDEFDAGDVEVVLRGADGEFTERLDAGTFLRGADDTRFVPGDRWRSTTHNQSGDVQLFVVDRATNTILHEATHEVDDG
ncbi:MAG: type IV pilin [Halovenus sp.]